MAKRDSGSRQTGKGKATKASGATTTASIDQRLLAFAEQLGRMAWTVQSKAEGWTNRETLSAQLASVRDTAADLLGHLAGTGTNPAARKAAEKTTKKKPFAAPARGASTGRSGGVVDAPGKKHRKPLPSDPGATIVDSQAAKLRTALPMAKTSRPRGRG